MTGHHLVRPRAGRYAPAMPSRRELIKMTDDEVKDFVGSAKSLQVACLNADGSPHLSTLWFAVVDDRIIFETYTRSQKIKNLERDPRIACLVEDGVTYETLRGVQINGTAELVRDHDEMVKVARAVIARNQPEVPVEFLDQAAEQMAAKRTGVIVHAERIVSWDHTKLDGAY